MSRPVGSASSSVTEVNFSEVEGETFEAPAAKPPARSQSQVEPWLGQRPLTFDVPEFKGATSSGPDLAAQAARENAARQSALKTLANLEGPLMELGAQCRDPETAFMTKDVHEFRKALHSAAFTKAASTLTPSDFRAALHEQVKRAWPQSTPQQAEQLRQYFMKEIGQTLREGIAPRLQELATTMLASASKEFLQTAADPAKVEQLATRLTAMAHPLADLEEQAVVRDLRAGFGLDLDEATVTPERLTVALRERASLLKAEARKMKEHGHGTVFRALAEQDVGPVFKQINGIREDSLLSSQIDGVKAQGEREATVIGAVRLASIVTAGAFTGGLALGGVFVGAGVSASLAAPAVLQKWQAVDTARAGESAGTMTAGAGEAAHRHAVIETGAAAASVVGATAINHGLHGVLSGAGTLMGAATHGAAEYVAEKTSETGAHALDSALSSGGERTGRDVLERAKR